MFSRQFFLPVCHHRRRDCGPVVASPSHQHHPQLGQVPASAEGQVGAARTGLKDTCIWIKLCKPCNNIFMWFIAQQKHIYASSRGYFVSIVSIGEPCNCIFMVHWVYY